ncbi:hypothetical protein F0562_003852 [Nyssa sinensis]|uniref:NPH3 domain-containing protein n=1 Tax=Nyssa sinensis TaxID=561372 RepID=A0A5J5BX87_9ASTE|nr:hypothetical protein F0562_003852 [Nyssa sinensis]
MAAEKPSSKGQAWFCTTGLPSDVVIEVDDMTFHLHKFPLMSKSRKLNELIIEQETNPTRVQTTSATTEGEDNGEEEIEEEEEHYCHITLPEFPGGSETFETAAKFCYGVKMELSSSNVAPLRCAGEVLEMTEEYSEDNLISRTERFLSQSVLKSINDSIKTLKSCERLMPLAETLGIVQRCIDSIAARASSVDPSLFGWPVNERAGNGRTSNQALWIETGGRRKASARGTGADSWFEELGHLSLSLFKRLIFAMKARDLSSEIIENCLIYYAKRYIPGISRSSRKPSSSSIPSESEQKEVLETIIANLPLEKNSGSSTATRFLFGLLRTASILNASAGLSSCSGEEDWIATRTSNIGRSTNTKLFEKFYELAVALPEHARLFDDGLYRAVDVYFKAHPWISEAEREKICGVIDCQKLTLEACTHAAQNERLPLRAVVQVLFFEQLQLRHAIAGTLLASEVAPADDGRPSNPRREEQEGDDTYARAVVVATHAQDGSSTWRAAVRENQVLRLDMDSMRSRVHELERECSTMKKAIEKIDKLGPRGEGGWRSSLTKRFGCKFRTQVCDSHEPTVVEARRGRNHHHQE